MLYIIEQMRCNVSTSNNSQILLFQGPSRISELNSLDTILWISKGLLFLKW